MSLKVFLSGAIENVDPDYPIGWRQEATKLLRLGGYEILDPTSISDTGFETPDEIVEKNLFLQRRADILLVEYMIPNRAYIGTDFELAWAKSHGQPSVVFCADQHKNRVYLKYMATRLESNMYDAVEYIMTNYPSY